ncbi:hypothetical protein BKA70DRAFT_1110167, partial [Coprinopsis sp. MPI-PUGE-AT-0042]
EELDLTSLFPNGSVSFRLSELPGTGLPLFNDLRVHIDNHRGPVPMNLSVYRMFGIPWNGNIVVFRYKSPTKRRPRAPQSQYQHISRVDLPNGINLLMALLLRMLIATGIYNDVKLPDNDLAMKLFA